MEYGSKWVVYSIDGILSFIQGVEYMKKKSEEYMEGFIQGLVLASTHFTGYTKDEVIKYMIQHLESKK